MDALPIQLYPRLLGESWDNVHHAIQRLHGDGKPVHATGTFRVQRGQGGLVRFMAWVGGLPAAGDAVALELIVTPHKGTEEWRRMFAGRPMVSVQRARPNGVLAERAGPLELRFQLAVRDHAIHYGFHRALLCLGPIRIPLPKWLSPHAEASETPATDDEVQVRVELRLPMLGRMIAYDGMVKVSERK